MSGRDALLDAAFDALVASGPSFATDTVVRRAGVSKGLLFHHFGSREGLLDAMTARILEETQQGLARLVDDFPNPRDRLEALAVTLLEDPVGQPPTHARHVLLFWLSEDATGEPRAALRDGLLREYTAALVREGIATGALKSGTDATRIALLLLGRWHGATTLYATGAPVDFDAEREGTLAELKRLAWP